MNARCLTILFLFTDRRWMPLTARLLDEWQRFSRSDGCAVVHEMHANSSGWGTPHYFELIQNRLPTVLRALESLPYDTSGRGLLLLDSDIVLRRNVGAWMHRFAARSGADFVVQQEWPCPQAPHCVNGGVWWVRRSAGGAQVLREAAVLMEQLRVPDQDALQIVAARSARRVHFLDRLHYPNGHVAQFDPQFSVSRAHLVHANWLRSYACKRAVLECLRNGGDEGVVKRLVAEQNCSVY